MDIVKREAHYELLKYDILIWVAMLKRSNTQQREGRDCEDFQEQTTMNEIATLEFVYV